jgi:(1->4)-alpha-D-glucan 1-alpha-D-glucosylmutase
VPAGAAVDAAVAAVSADPTRLRALMDAQAYRLVDWRRAAGETSYRRFFNVSDLVGVRVEDPAVFAGTHARVLRWVGRGWLDGLRIDHVDGLWDPLAYLHRLRDTAGIPLWVEKILAAGERLRADWPVAGTTGYEFTGDVEQLFLDPDGLAAIEAWYRRRIARRASGVDFPSAVASGKRRILDTWLAPDLRHLTRRLWTIAGHEARARGVGRRELATALAEVMIAFPVYRTYVGDGAVSDADRVVVDEAIARARRVRGVAPAAIDVVAEVLRLEDVDRRPAADAVARRDFVRRFQQTTGPVMAKGVEDTAFYRWVPLASRNEVGADPGVPPAHAGRTLHAANAERAPAWPACLLTTTTHDTKRSADVRARLDVLSEVPGEWTEHVARWRAVNRAHRRRMRGRWAPDANTEYLLYQSLVGLWPLGAPDAADLADVQARLGTYMRKAAREAKLRTSWLRPDPEFEAALDAFIARLFAPASAPFLADVARFVGRIARPGLWNALARTVVHLTAPGVPDLYQGDELWTFALADPDNRRLVDFARRREALASLDASPVDVRPLVAHPEDGRIKLHVVRTALGLRRAEPALFAGGYVPLVAAGTTARHVFAFARQAGDRAAIVVVPRCTHTLAPAAAAPVGGVWADATLALPDGIAVERLTNVLTGEVPGSSRIDAILATCPVALLVA